MKTIKVIDLLNKIANREPLPKKIMHNNIIYDWDIVGYLHYEDYHYSERAFLEGYRTDMCLNEEVQIIEDTPEENKKIEPIKEEVWELNNSIIKNKINEIIDKINKGE